MASGTLPERSEPQARPKGGGERASPWQAHGDAADRTWCYEAPVQSGALPFLGS